MTPSRCEVFEYRDLLLQEESTTTRPSGARGVQAPSGDGGIRVLSSDLRTGVLRWEHPASRTSPSGTDSWGSLDVHIVVALADGWFVTRRSEQVLSPGLWQHAATVRVTPAMVSALATSTSSEEVSRAAHTLDLDVLTHQTLLEELGLGSVDLCIRPWLVQRFLSGSAHAVYVLADARPLNFDKVMRLRRRSRSRSTDGAAVIGSVSEWRGRETWPGLLVPASSPRNLLRGAIG